MRFNSIASEEPYQGLKCSRKFAGNGVRLSRTVSAGAAWLPSARVLRCSLQWGNERNPRPVLQVSRGTAPTSGRKAGMTSNQHGPLMPWATLMLQWSAQWVAKPQGGANPIKADLSSDWGLQLALMKLDSLVIADHNAAVNTFSSLVLTIKAPSSAVI